MPIIILLENAIKFENDLKDYFKDKFTVEVRKGEYKRIRSEIATKESSKLRILLDLSKPERYEIYCLARKNNEEFLIISDGNRNENNSNNNNLDSSSSNININSNNSNINSNNNLDSSNSSNSDINNNLYSNNNNSSSKEKNLIVIEKFNGEVINKKLLESKITETTANKRSKGISLRGMSDLKVVINKVNKEYENKGEYSLILKESEERMIKMWNFNNQLNVEEAEECYRKLIRKY